MIAENSSGGIVIKNGNILLIMVKTMSGNKLWTFPKGHIEDGESPQQAAIREVMEEGGVRCRIIDENEFFINHYKFIRNGDVVSKTVRWYLMEPIEESGIVSSLEVEDRKWVSIPEALKLLSYDSDKKMVEMLLERMEGKNVF
ncbi:MAG: NUDIX hydrolase [Elusimicrobiales bacterium]